MSSTGVAAAAGELGAHDGHRHRNAAMLRRTAGRGRAVPAELVSFMVVSPLIVPARPPVRQVMVGEATARPPDRTSDGRAVSGRAEPRRCSGSATLLRQAC